MGSSALGLRGGHDAANNRFHQPRTAEIFSAEVVDGQAIPKHGDPVAEVEDLIEPV